MKASTNTYFSTGERKGTERGREEEKEEEEEW